MKQSGKLIVLMISLILITPLASASTFINIRIDDTGEATFTGETDKELTLPSGIKLKNGIINGETQELTNKQGDVWTFSYELPESEFYIVLPQNSVIKNITQSEIYIEGDKLSVYAEDRLEVSYTIDKESRGIDLIVILFIVLLIVVNVIYFLKRKRKKPKDKLEIIKQVLNEREKLILDKLKETGKIKGSYLRRACDIPKPSFYRHIQELEKKGLVKKSGDGRNKFIELIKKD